MIVRNNQIGLAHYYYYQVNLITHLLAHHTLTVIKLKSN